jgi:hypothetical protein
VAEGHEKTARALRVYEYVDESGIVFWSLTRLPGFSIRRLMLVDTRGRHFREHISEVHEMAFQSEILEKDRRG